MSLASGMRTSIATVALSGTLPDKLEAAAAAGFDAVEMMEADLLAFDGAPRDVRAIAADLGLAIDLYQPFRDFEAMPAPQRARNLDRARRKFDIMAELGTGLLLVCSNTQPAAIDDPARAAADLAEMAALAHARGLRIGYEALSWGRHVRRWGDAWDIVQRAGHPALGLVVDSFHTLALGDDPAGLAAVPAERIFYVQLADAPRLGMDVLSWSRHHRSFPGQGDLDVPGFLRAVLASGYGGPLSLEVFNDHFRAAPASFTARDGLRSLVLTEAAVRGAGALPDLPVVDGIAFLEFALDDAARQALSAQLGQLGFRFAGRHRSKDVELWQQGGISLVLNAEPDSAAAEHFQHHGPSVCATALRVDDAARVLARARALLVAEWHERVGTGERRIPAVRTPDGTLLYLIDRAAGDGFWAEDFALEPKEPGGAGLDSVDHMALALPPGQMDGFVLFWRALFGLSPQPALDLPDPFGLIRSRALVNDTGTLRLSLNASDVGATSTSRFVSAFAGAGVHHVALRTNDVAASVDALRAAGAPVLPITGNYYEDLAARMALDPAELAALERRALLFDADADAGAGGQFRHVYLEPFQGRFFFEIVQRDPGYAGFGAANAGVRLAAQTRHQHP